MATKGRPMKTCRECNFSIIDGGALACLQYGVGGKFYEIEMIKEALSNGKCERFEKYKPINNPVETNV